MELKYIVTKNIPQKCNVQKTLILWEFWSFEAEMVKKSH